ENCRLGISLGIVPGIVSNPILKNVYIEDNVVIQGSGESNHYGIVALGGVEHDTQGSIQGILMAENIHITNNKLRGFGGLSTPSGAVGAITVYLANNMQIVGNEIDRYSQAAITLYHTVTDCKILRNTIGESRDASSSENVVAIDLNNYGLYGI